MTNSNVPILETEEDTRKKQKKTSLVALDSVKHLSLAPKTTTLPPNSSLKDDDDDDYDDFDFGSINFDLIQHRDISLIYRFFQVCLAATALLDFAAAIAHHWDDVDEEIQEIVQPRRRFWKPREVNHDEPQEQQQHDFFEPVIDFLVANGTFFGFLFSAFWFLNAFIEANRLRARYLREQDQENILKSKAEESDAPVEKEQAKPKARHMFDNPQFVYVGMIFVQLIMLPVGFYMFCYSRILQIRDEDAVFEVVYHFDDDEDEPDLYETYNIHANLCLGFAIIKHFMIRLSKLLHVRFRHQIRRRGRRLAKKVVIGAVRNPFKFHRRVRKALRAVRWLKYLAPLIGTSNKLKGNVSTLFKRLRQRRETALARRVREKLWDGLSEEELREYCARLIQKTFRAHQRRKMLHALQLFQDCKEQIAARRLQRHFRAILKRARNRLKRKEAELQLLREKEKEAKKQKTELDEDDKFRMYTLHNELQRETSDLLNKKLLLRPNTTFAVAWRCLFVFAVVVEITQLALKPTMEKYEDSDGNPLNMTTFLEESLIPSPVSNLPECAPPPVKRGLVGFVVKIFSNRTASVDTATGSCPWYCESPIYSNFQLVSTVVMKRLIKDVFEVLGIICFLDVFITFFIGEYDAETGQLGPAPFFQRWILPGICLQLLVNPTMGTTVEILSFAVTGLIRQGPFRVLRWTVAFFFPAFLVCKHYVKKRWLRLVSSENYRARAHS